MQKQQKWPSIQSENTGKLFIYLWLHLFVLLAASSGGLLAESASRSSVYNVHAIIFDLDSFDLLFFLGTTFGSLHYTFSSSEIVLLDSVDKMLSKQLHMRFLIESKQCLLMSM